MQPSVILISFYGLFLIICGIISVVFIGSKAKTALISGGLSGSVSLLLAFLMGQDKTSAYFEGIALTFLLFIVFAWRASKTLFSLMNMIQEQNKDLHGKGIAFLIISLMCIVSLFTFAMQIVFFGMMNKDILH